MNNGKPYAKALLDLSKENNIDINQIVSELQLVNSYFDEEFISFLNNPKISKDNKKEVFNKAFNNLNKNVFAVLMVLIDNNKIVYLSEVINELLSLIDEVNNVVTVEVISISKLSEIEKLSITNYFIKKLNKKITLKEVIDEKLLDKEGKLHLDKAKLMAYSHGEYFGLGNFNHHRASDDAEMCAKIFYRMVEKLEDGTLSSTGNITFKGLVTRDDGTIYYVLATNKLDNIFILL